MSTRDQGHCLTIIHCHADLYFQTSAPKVLDKLKSIFMSDLYDRGDKIRSTNVGHMTKAATMHAHIWINPLKVFFTLEPNGKDGNPWMTVNFL